MLLVRRLAHVLCVPSEAPPCFAVPMTRTSRAFTALFRVLNRCLAVLTLPSLLLGCCRASLPYFTTHTELVRLQKASLEEKRSARKGLASDKDWTGDGFVKETETMVSN